MTDALEDFNRAIELDPEYGAAFYSRATLHTQMGNEDLAVQDAEMVTHLTNKSIEEFANEIYPQSPFSLSCFKNGNTCI